MAASGNAVGPVYVAAVVDGLGVAMTIVVGEESTDIAIRWIVRMEFWALAFTDSTGVGSWPT